MKRRAVRPVVAANFAVTWDGRITTRKLTPADFSSRTDRRRLLEIRADAILFGSGTVAAENLAMGLPAADLREARRARGKPDYPARVLVSGSGRVDPNWKFFQARFSPVAVYSSGKMPARVRTALSKLEHVRLHCGEDVEMGNVLRHLHSEYGIKRLVCEGGAGLFHSLAARDLLDELYLTWCPRIFGGAAAPTITGAEDSSFLPRRLSLKLTKMSVVESECFSEYRILRNAHW